MARAVVQGRPLTTARRYVDLCGLPHLSEPALSIYSKLVRERLDKFPQPVEDQADESIKVPMNISIDEESLQSLQWSHGLQHDAESVFWLLVWWAIHLRPRSSHHSKINDVKFGILTNIDLVTKFDPRTSFMDVLRNGTSWLDPAYRELEPLFSRMASHLTGDLYWGEYGGATEMREPDFLHEALQRILFDFLMQNKTKPFMKLEKDPRPREVDHQPRRHGEGQVTPSKRSHSTMGNDPERIDEPKTECEVSFLSSPALVHTTYSCRVLHPKGHVEWVTRLEEVET